MSTINTHDTSVKCTGTGTNKTYTDPIPDEVTYDYSEAVKCLFCCCCLGSGSGSGSGADSGSGSGSGSVSECCPEADIIPATDTFAVTNSYGVTQGEEFQICSVDGTGTTELTLVNGGESNLGVDVCKVEPIVDPPACASLTEVFPIVDIPFEEPLIIPAGGSITVTLSYSGLAPCCVYTVFYVTLSQVISYSVSSPSSKQVVDTGVEIERGTVGIAKAGCWCSCSEPVPPTFTKSVAPSVPSAEDGFAVSHEFIDLPGELNCRYLWKLHVTWIGKGEGYLFARDRCSVLHIDKRSRDSTDLDYSPPTEEFDYQLLVCGPTTICMQMKNKVVDGVSQAGRVTVSAERLECMSGSNPDCCCGPYPACTCDPEVKPVILCQAQKENLPVGWVVDEAVGRLVATRTDDTTPVIGLAYTVSGDITCTYKVRLELEIAAGADCVPIFMGGDHAAVELGVDGRGSLYADLWVCGGTVFTLLMSGQGGEATFKVTYANESRVQTPLCCA